MCVLKQWHIEKIHVNQVQFAMPPPLNYKGRQTAYRSLLPLCLRFPCRYTNRQMEREMWALLSPSMLLFLGPSLPVVDSLLASLVRRGIRLVLPKKSLPDATGGSFSLGPGSGLICLNWNALLLMEMAFYTHLKWYLRHFQINFQNMTVRKLSVTPDLTITLYMHVGKNCAEIYNIYIIYLFYFSEHKHPNFGIICLSRHNLRTGLLIAYLYLFYWTSTNY